MDVKISLIKNNNEVSRMFKTKMGDDFDPNSVSAPELENILIEFLASSLQKTFTSDFVRSMVNELIKKGEENGDK